MPSSGNTENQTSSNINDASADYSGYSIATKLNPIDGLTVVAGYEIESEATLQDAKSTTYGASYTMGEVSFGYQKTNNDVRLESHTDGENKTAADAIDYTGTHYGVAYKVSDALSIGFAVQNVDKKGTANDEEYQQVEAAYSLGALGIGMSYGQVENVNGVTGTDADQLMIRLSSKL
jgi:outer membrane receptor for ferrienterochelin and colicin